jgi:RNA polymerase sigma factor (sigma-70 family)
MKTSTPVQSVSVERPEAGNVVNLPTAIVAKGRTTVDARKALEPQEINALMAAVAARQDIDAYQVLYKHFVPKVRAYMSKIGSDRAFADEMAQEAMLTVWRKARLFDPARGQASTWIYTIARNVRIDALRRGPRPTFDPNDPAFVPEDEPAADVAFERQQDADRLRVAMASLKPDEIKTLRLSFFEDMAHPAIATALGIPIGTVKSRIRNACLKLRAILKDA